MKGLGQEHKHYNDGQQIVRLVANWLVGIIIIIDKLFSFIIDRKVCFDFAIYMEGVSNTKVSTSCTHNILIAQVK